MVSTLSIGQVSERTGLSVHALRFYEREGLLAQPVQREGNGRRVYSEDDIEWLAICTSLRASGMPLTAIRRYAELVRQGPGNEAERLELLREHQEYISSRIRQLTKAKAMIRYKVMVYQEHLDRGMADTLWTGQATPDGQAES